MRAVTPDQTTQVVRGPEGHRYVMTDYLGSHAERRPGEQAYLVRQEAAELRAHFHEVDQFQVVLDGTGTLGADHAARGVLHYTDAYTTYGPIRTDPVVGLTYFTLRRDPTTGINYMPDEREKRRRAAGRGEHFTVRLDESVAPGAGPVELARTRRGATAYGVRAEATGPLAADLPDGQAGYAVVLAGALQDGDRRLPTGSLVAFDSVAELTGRGPTSAVPALRAAEQGAEVALLLFPPAG